MPLGSASRPRFAFGARALLLAWLLVALAFACSSSELDSSITDSGDGSTNPVGPDATISPEADGANAPDAPVVPDGSPPPSDAGADADGGLDAAGDGRAPSGGPAGTGLVACGTETCTANSEACTGVLPTVFIPSADASSAEGGCQPYPPPRNTGISLRCDDHTDCFPGYKCYVGGMSYALAAPPLADAGLSSLYSRCNDDESEFAMTETDASPASFRLHTCGDAGGDAASCSAGETCHRQLCQGFAFYLCGDIPDGACAR